MSSIAHTMKRMAYTVNPRAGAGGTLTFCNLLREGLGEHGWEVIPLAVRTSEEPGDKWDDGLTRRNGFAILGNGKESRKDLVCRIAEWCYAETIDVFMTADSYIGVAALPHLPIQTRRVARVTSITSTGYRLDTARIAHTDCILTSSKRQQDDLLTKYRIPPDKLALVPHGVPVVANDRGMADAGDSPLRLIYAGRIDHEAKGVLHIARIVDNISRRGVEWTLTVCGDGHDAQRLGRSLAKFGRRVAYLGAIPNSEVYKQMQQADVLLMPSSFEGFGYSLIEAMSVGVVPVVSRIRGVTDWIVRQNATGILCAAGVPKSYADAIVRLDRNRSLLRQMGDAASRDVIRRFSRDQSCRQYAELFNRLALMKPEYTPLHIEGYGEITAHRNAWHRRIPIWRRLPRPIKFHVRRLLAR